jgi:hypothetical protein
MRSEIFHDAAKVFVLFICHTNAALNDSVSYPFSIEQCDEAFDVSDPTLHSTGRR